MDEVLASVAETIKNFAVIYLVDITEVPDFNTMYELYDPSTVMFFFRNKHIMIDLGTGNNNKINWAMKDKQEFIDIVETVYRGARKGCGLGEIGVLAEVEGWKRKFLKLKRYRPFGHPFHKQTVFLDKGSAKQASSLIFIHSLPVLGSQMILTHGPVRPSPFSLTRLARLTRHLSISNNNPFSISVSRYGSSRSPSQFTPILSVASQQSISSVQKGDKISLEQPEIIFMGTGTSEGIPRVSCLTDPLKKCAVCSKAVEPGNKNRRLNTSILIRFPKPSGICNILIDAGKFFYQSALRWFPTYGIRTIDAVVITHSHADAIGGLDDLRDWTNNVQPRIPIYVAERDFEVMKKTHYYLVDTSVVTPGAAVSELQFDIIHEKPFIVHDLKFTPLPVWHGRNYRSLGFRFGNVCYISDVSEIPDETYPLLRDCEILIMDALRPDRSSSTHFGLPKALEEVRKIKPKRTLFTGMMHLMDHEKVNEGLLKLMETEGLDVQLSYDGLRVPINL
ncbi:hypothetical protein L1987_45309 [Smallanthus sonchifolius]|uniref:Uncharacterized protein n=1 Tax=Smallanthus sonchifolius TaxID=185202 RepID=A0ACB9GU02_9ASTR|nr:hypothetical protein L1987_45309 [Smallanthus sonchifolius]